MKVGFMPSVDLLTLGVVWAPLLRLITHESLKTVKQLEYTKAGHTLKPTRYEIKGKVSHSSQFDSIIWVFTSSRDRW